MKKTVKILAYGFGFVLLLIILAFAVPFLIDFNQFKPQIQQLVADKSYAKVDFESARLQIFPKIGINIKNFSVENTDADFAGTKLFTVGEVLVNTQFLPLLSKKIVGRVEIKKPEFMVAKKGLKNNITSLIKVDPEAKPPAQNAKTDQKSANKNADPATQKDQMQFVKDNVVIEGIFVSNANVTIKNLDDDGPSTPARVEDFNLSVTNIGLERDIKTEIATQIDLKKEDMSVSGPFLISMINNIKMNGSGLESATFAGKVDLDKLNINAKNAFVKNSSVPLNLQFQGVFKPTSLDLTAFSLQLQSLFVKAKVSIVDFKALVTNANVEVKNDNLTALGDVLPQHKKMLMDGKIYLLANLLGTMSKPETAKLDADLKLNLTGTDLLVGTHITSVQPPKGAITVVSQNFDLGGLVKPFMPTTSLTKTAANATAEPGKNSPAASPVAGTTPDPHEPNTAKDFTLTKDQKKLLNGMDIAFKMNLRKILYDDVKIENFLVDIAQKSLKTQLNNFSVLAFDGTVQAKGLIDLEPSPIGFNQEFHLKNIKPEKLMAAVKPEHKDLIKGVVNLDLTAKGSGTTVPTLNKTLNGGGQFKFLSGQLNTPSIARIMQKEFDQFATSLATGSVSEGVLKSIDKILQNPMLKSLPNKPSTAQLREKLATISKINIEDKASAQRDLKDVAGKITIKDGRMYLASQTTESSGNYAVDSSVGLDLSLGGTVIYHASEATKKRMLAQSSYANLLLDKQNNLVLQANLGGTAVDPKVSLKLEALKEIFTVNARSMFEKEGRKSGEDFLKKLIGGKKAEINAQSDEEKKKAKAEGEKKGEEAKKNLEEEAKKQLKGLFGN